MDSILIILKTKWPKGFICPYSYTGNIFYNVRIYSRSQVSVYRTIGPLVGFLMRLWKEILDTVKMIALKVAVCIVHVKLRLHSLVSFLFDTGITSEISKVDFFSK